MAKQANKSDLDQNNRKKPNLKIFVKAKTNAKKECVEKIDETHFAVTVKDPPKNGLANAAIKKALAEFLRIASSRIILVSGFSSKQKVFEIV
jgi:uncharacterized protein YggU (UPF0235/DUF167 family)